MRLAVLSLLLSGCSAEVTLLVGPRFSEGDRELGATLMVLQPYGKRGISGCLHNSLPSRGEPFNDRPEFTFDHCGTGVRWGGR